MSDLSTLHMETPEIEPRKLLRNINCHNFSLGCPIQAHRISRRSKLKNGTSRERKQRHGQERNGAKIFNYFEEGHKKLDCGKVKTYDLLVLPSWLARKL